MLSLSELDYSQACLVHTSVHQQSDSVHTARGTNIFGMHLEYCPLSLHRSVFSDKVEHCPGLLLNRAPVALYCAGQLCAGCIHGYIQHTLCMIVSVLLQSGCQGCEAVWGFTNFFMESCQSESCVYATRWLQHGFWESIDHVSLLWQYCCCEWREHHVNKKWGW